jgi:hypothetical protein
MKNFGLIAFFSALAFVGLTYYVVQATSCTEHQCFEGMHPELSQVLAGYTCTCVGN